MRTYFARIAPLLAVLTALVAVLALAQPAGAAERQVRPVLLGSRHFNAPNGIGWGTPHPGRIFNGGDPNGDVTHITWDGWRNATAYGHGMGNQFRPGGGYYRHQVRVQLKATRLGHCVTNGPRAYTRLWARFKQYPGGPWGRWFLWQGAGQICHN